MILLLGNNNIFLAPKPAIRHSEGDEEGFICCVPPSSLLEGHSQEEHVVSIALINSICHDYSPNATQHPSFVLVHHKALREGSPRRTFASFAKISSQQNDDAQAVECRITYELEEKIKLNIVAILTLSCFDGNSVGWMGPSLPLNNNCNLIN